MIIDRNNILNALRGFVGGSIEKIFIKKNYLVAWTPVIHDGQERKHQGFGGLTLYLPPPTPRNFGKNVQK